MMFKYDLRKLTQLKYALDELRELEGSTITPLTDELLDALVRYVDRNKNWGWNVAVGPNWIFLQPGGGACGCMGPEEGDPVCRCAMRNLLYQYRYDVAIKLSPVETA